MCTAHGCRRKKIICTWSKLWPWSRTDGLDWYKVFLHAPVELFFNGAVRWPLDLNYSSSPAPTAPPVFYGTLLAVLACKKYTPCHSLIANSFSSPYFFTAMRPPCWAQGGRRRARLSWSTGTKYIHYWTHWTHTHICLCGVGQTETQRGVKACDAGIKRVQSAEVDWPAQRHSGRTSKQTLTMGWTGTLYMFHNKTLNVIKR